MGGLGTVISTSQGQGHLVRIVRKDDNDRAWPATDVPGCICDYGNEDFDCSEGYLYVISYDATTKKFTLSGSPSHAVCAVDNSGAITILEAGDYPLVSIPVITASQRHPIKKGTKPSAPTKNQQYPDTATANKLKCAIIYNTTNGVTTVEGVDYVGLDGTDIGSGF